MNLLSTKEAAAYLGISPPTLRKLAKERKIKSIRPAGTAMKFEKSWLDEYLATVTEDLQNE